MVTKKDPNKRIDRTKKRTTLKISSWLLISKTRNLIRAIFGTLLLIISVILLAHPESARALPTFVLTGTAVVWFAFEAAARFAGDSTTEAPPPDANKKKGRGQK